MTTRGHQSAASDQGVLLLRAGPNRCGQALADAEGLTFLNGGKVARRRRLPNLYGDTGDCQPGPYRPRHAAPPMMTRALRRAGLALTRADRLSRAAPTNTMPTMDALLSAHLRWLEMVGRETTAVPSRRPTLSMIPAPV